MKSIKMNCPEALSGVGFFTPSILWVIIIWIQFLPGCSVAQSIHSIALNCEAVSIEFETGQWQLTSQNIDNSMADTEWRILSTESTSWNESFRLSAFSQKKNKQPTPTEMMEAIKGILNAQCPNVEWNIIDQSEHDIIYESIFSVCRGHAALHQLVRIFDGSINRYKLTYQAHLDRLSPKKRAEWIERIKKAEHLSMDCIE